MKGVILNKIVECTTIIILIILFTIQNYFKNSYSANMCPQAQQTHARKSKVATALYQLLLQMKEEEKSSRLQCMVQFIS